MFCPMCGTKLGENANFCKKCGYKIDVKKNIDNRVIEKNPLIYIRVIELSQNPEYKNLKVAKIKKIREEFNIGLEEAKSIIDEYEENPINFKNKYIDSKNIDITKKKKNDINSDIENTKQNNYDYEKDEYERTFKSSIEEEDKYNNYEYAIDCLIFIAATIYYIANGWELIVSIISALVVAAVADFIFITRLSNAIKKQNNCYKAKEKYNKFNILRQTMEPSIALQMVELEFKESQSENHGMLYYLLCVLVIVLIFALC